jgi:adenylate cyclase
MNESKVAHTAWLKRKVRKVTDRTIVWSDLAGMKEAARDLSEKEIQNLLEAHGAMVVETVKGSSGRVVCTDGDGILISFDAESAAEAVNTAIKLQENAQKKILPLGVSLQVGVSTGAVVEEDGGTFGPVAVLAHSLAVDSNAGAIVIDNATAAALNASDIASETGTSSNRGAEEYIKSLQQHTPRDFDAPVNIHEVYWGPQLYGMK